MFNLDIFKAVTCGAIAGRKPYTKARYTEAWQATYIGLAINRHLSMQSTPYDLRAMATSHPSLSARLGPAGDNGARWALFEKKFWQSNFHKMTWPMVPKICRDLFAQFDPWLHSHQTSSRGFCSSSDLPANCEPMAGANALVPLGANAAAGKNKLDLSDLAHLLDAEESIRTHLRSEGSPVLFPEKTPVTIKGACEDQIHTLLKILLKRTVETEGRPQPPIHPLREQLALLYHKMSRNDDDKTVIEDSWYIRKFLVLVKMKARKKKVSRAASRHLENCNWRCKNPRYMFRQTVLFIYSVMHMQ